MRSLFPYLCNNHKVFHNFPCTSRLKICTATTYGNSERLNISTASRPTSTAPRNHSNSQPDSSHLFQSYRFHAPHTCIDSQRCWYLPIRDGCSMLSTPVLAPAACRLTGSISIGEIGCDVTSSPVATGTGSKHASKRRLWPLSPPIVNKFIDAGLGRLQTWPVAPSLGGAHVLRPLTRGDCA